MTSRTQTDRRLAGWRSTEGRAQYEVAYDAALSPWPDSWPGLYQGSRVPS